MSEKTPSETPRMAGKNGGELLVGNPGNKGGGRTKDEFRARMRELASGDDALEYLRACLAGVHGPKAHTSAMAFAAEHGYGKPAQPLEGDPNKPISIRIIRD